VTTVAVIPTRYEPQRIDALVRLIAPEVDRVIVLDNGHDPALVFDLANVEVVDTRGEGLYRQWNRGRQLAGPVNVAILNDDIRVLPGTLRMLAAALRSRGDIGCVYPDRHTRLKRGLPPRIRLTVDRDPVGSRDMTGYCFMFRGELDLPLFDEGYAWWYGDTQFDEDVKLAGYGVAQVNGLPIEHVSDAEAHDWQRRPELKAMVELDGQRWAELHAEIRDGRWHPRPGSKVGAVIESIPTAEVIR
jgi:GT2 family glycosyltransferase